MQVTGIHLVGPGVHALKKFRGFEVLSSRCLWRSVPLLLISTSIAEEFPRKSCRYSGPREIFGNTFWDYLGKSLGINAGTSWEILSGSISARIT